VEIFGRSWDSPNHYLLTEWSPARESSMMCRDPYGNGGATGAVKPLMPIFLGK
jgi:hypothetical protein